MRIGLNLIAGFDYYVAQNLYLGAELGLGFSYKKMSTITSTMDPLPTGAKQAADEIQGSTIDFGPNVVSAFRLGYNF